MWGAGRWLNSYSPRIRRWLKESRNHPQVMVILGVNPLTDGGGGKRPALLAQEMVRRGWRVLYTFAFPRDESLTLQFEPTHPSLLEVGIRDVDLSWLCKGLLNQPLPRVLVEVPHPAYAPLIETFVEAGAQVCYDAIDDWQGSLGRPWYREDVERAVARLAQGLVASAPILAERLSAWTGRPCLLVPNAVDLQLFDSHKNYPRPRDLPEGPILLYAGALWGDWMDWQLVDQLARASADCSLVLIGDHRGEGLGLPDNVKFLGLKKQTDLPAYYQHTWVALIPWHLDGTTRATSPLKVYEYLAMECPVVAPPLPPLQDLPGVFLAQDRAQFLEKVARARETELRGTTLEYVAAHTWARRVDQILGLHPL